MSNNSQDKTKVDIKLCLIRTTYIDKMVLSGSLAAFVLPLLLILEYTLLEINSLLYILFTALCFISGLYLFIIWQSKKKIANTIPGIVLEYECPKCMHKGFYFLLNANFTCPKCNGHNKLAVSKSNLSKLELPITETKLIECKHCCEKLEVNSIKNHFICTSCKKTVK